MTQSVPPGGGAGDPLADFSGELEELQAKAAAAQERLRAAVATVQAPDGAVSVTVGPSGVLQELRFGPRAYERPPQALSSLVMQLIGRAQQKVSAEVADAFSGMVGENSAARELLTEFLPEPEPAEGTPPGGAKFMPEADDRPPTPPPPPRQRPPGPPPPSPPPNPQQRQHGQPRRRPRPAPDEDDGESNPW